MNRASLAATATAILLGFPLTAAMAQNDTAGGSGPSVRSTIPEQAPLKPGARAAASKLDRDDRKFIIKTAEEGLYEVEMAKLAERKSNNDAIKRFASMLIGDHSQANAELQRIAADNGVPLSSALSKNKRRALEKMAKLEGDKFDREFAHEAGLEHHEHDIKEFEKASKKVKLAELKAWIDKTLPTLHAHLAAAAKLPQNANR